MKALLTAAVLIVSAQAALAFDLECPNSINTHQSLIGSVNGWEPSTESDDHILNTALFSEGHPSQNAFLHPDKESGELQWSSTWLFEDSSKIWLSCQYRGTVVSLAKVLPAGLKRCTIAGNNSKGIKISSIRCQ